MRATYTSEVFTPLIDRVDAHEQEMDVRSLRALEEALTSPALRKLRQDWESLAPGKRQAFLRNGLRTSLSERLANLIPDLLSEGLDALPDFIRQYAHFREQRGLGVEAQITSASPLSEEQKTELMKILLKKAGQPVILRESIDQTLQGGFRVQLNDWIYDGSVKGRLQCLFENFMS